MAGCLSCGEGGNISPESVRRWTEKLSNILLSSTARQKFHEYLESRQLEQGQKLLEFWEKCDSFLMRAEKSGHRDRFWKPKGHSGHVSSHQSQHETFKQEAELIVESADSDINFDPAQMQILYEAVQNGEHEKIVTVVSDAKKSAAEMLEDEGYHQYCHYLLKSQGLLN